MTTTKAPAPAGSADVCVPLLNQLIEGQKHLETMLSKVVQTVMATQVNVAALTTSVARNTTLIGSALQLIQGFSSQLGALSQQLKDAIAADDPAAIAATQTAIDNAKSALDAVDDELAAAIVANTPAANNPPSAPAGGGSAQGGLAGGSAPAGSAQAGSAPSGSAAA